MRLETIHPSELAAADVAKWRGHQRPGTQSPYLTPDWAQIVGAARGDARVCVIGEGEGYFGAQRLSRFHQHVRLSFGPSMEEVSRGLDNLEAMIRAARG